MEGINLYMVTTKGIGDFYAIAKSYDDAAEAVKDALDKADYGFYGDREVRSVKLVRQMRFNDGEPWFSGGDINYIAMAKGILKED